MENKNNTKDSRVKVKVVGIEWDTDGESVNLPQYDIIEMTQEEYDDVNCGDPGIIADKLSDKYGYCVLSYENDLLLSDNEK